MSKKLLILAAFAAMLSGCSSDSDTSKQFATTQNPIINGSKDTLTAHNAVVMLATNNEFFCTGTLIDPNYVLTAGHCVHKLTSSEKRSFVVGVGNTNTAALRNSYAVSAIYEHEKYTETNDGSCYNDIALLKLAKSVPSSVATPIPPLPPEYAVTQAEIDKTGVENTFSGFGYTENGTYGTKLKMSMKIKGSCGAYNTPKSSTSGCYMGKFEIPVTNGWWNYTSKEDIYTDYGTIFYVQEVGGPCSGDSGGPAFITRNGKEYVLGVTSYGDEDCTIYGVSTSVPDFYDWLVAKAPTVFANVKYENCTDGKDNDGDGKADCMDSDCSFHVSCINAKVENCTDGKDNDGDNLIDCKDPDCANDNACKPHCGDGIVNNTEECDGKAFTQNKTTCVVWDSGKYASGSVTCTSNCTIDYSACKLKPTKEICNDGIDNDQDDILDCFDSDCTLDPACAENCTDGLDNDGDGLTDCDDGYCATHTACIEKPALQENCSNGIDDDGDDLIDCKDPDCASNSACYVPMPVLVEDCTNEEDDDNDGFIDCKDYDCRNDSSCKVDAAELKEDCANHYDDDYNGLIDCDDPACSSAAECAEKIEICNNSIDDDGDNKVDCDDPACFKDSSCIGKIEICGNGVDDDFNGLKDCDDPACFSICKTSSESVQEEICNDSIDNDGDNLIDCLDPDCAGKESCASSTGGEICDNNMDDDGDFLADCSDPDCAGAPNCIREICGNGIDDDGDDLIDSNDPDCNLLKTIHDSCSATPKKPSSAPIIPMIFGLFGLGILIRRRKDS